MNKKTEDTIEVQDDTKLDDDKKWCVYCHTNKENGKRYFGITSQEPEDRWRGGLGYKKSKVFWRAINQYTWDGFEHEVILSNLTEEEAKQKEIELIALYKTNCSKYQNPSYGYNLTDGGDGTSGVRPWNYGIPMSDEQKEAVRRAHTGKPLSEEHRKKLSDAKKGKLPNNYTLIRSKEMDKKRADALRGRTKSDEVKQKISEAKKGQYMNVNSSRFRPIYCIELCEIFWGARDVENKYGFFAGNVGACCRGQRNYAYTHPITNEKLHWLYAEDAIDKKYITQQQLDDYIQFIKQKGNDA